MKFYMCLSPYLKGTKELDRKNNDFVLKEGEELNIDSLVGFHIPLVIMKENDIWGITEITTGLSMTKHINKRKCKSMCIRKLKKESEKTYLNAVKKCQSINGIPPQIKRRKKGGLSNRINF